MRLKEALLNSHVDSGYESYHDYMRRRLAEVENDPVDLDPDDRHWEYDGFGRKRDKSTFADVEQVMDRLEKKLDKLISKLEEENR